MFLEVRTSGKKKKFYLIHSYRDEGKTKRISRYLGTDLSQKELSVLRTRAEQIISEQTKREPYETELTVSEIKAYKSFEKEIIVKHLDWERFTEFFTYNTNAIEGSEVAYEDARKIIERKSEPKNSDELETRNVAKAVNYVRYAKENLSLALIKKLHAICFSTTKHHAGRLRNVEVIIKDKLGNIIHQGAPAKDVKKLLTGLTRWYNEHRNKYPALVLSAIVHNQFEKIHPFQDGNGRVGRLLLNYVLLKHEHPPITIDLKDRQEYYACLREYDRTGDVRKTLKFLVSQYRKQ